MWLKRHVLFCVTILNLRFPKLKTNFTTAYLLSLHLPICPYGALKTGASDQQVGNLACLWSKWYNFSLRTLKITKVSRNMVLILHKSCSCLQIPIFFILIFFFPQFLKIIFSLFLMSLPLLILWFFYASIWLFYSHLFHQSFFLLCLFCC